MTEYLDWETKYLAGVDFYKHVIFVLYFKKWKYSLDKI